MRVPDAPEEEEEKSAPAQPPHVPHCLGEHHPWGTLRASSPLRSCLPLDIPYGAGRLRMGTLHFLPAQRGQQPLLSALIFLPTKEGFSPQKPTVGFPSLLPRSARRVPSITLCLAAWQGRQR